MFRVFAVLTILLASFALPADAAKRVALVIGNAKYTHVGELNTPPRDVRLIVDTLRSVGFDDVRLAEDLTKEKMLVALQEFSDVAENAEVAVIYFAGHGIEVDRENYLVPIDAKLEKSKDAKFQAIELEQVRGAVSEASKLRMVVLDACRNNPFKLAAKDGTRSLRSRGLIEVQPGVNELIAYSAQAGVLADDGPAEGNSPFAASLAKWIKTPGMDIRFVMGNVRDEVLAGTSPTDERDGPQIPYVESSLGGEPIVFSRALDLALNVEQPPVPQAQPRGTYTIYPSAPGEQVSDSGTFAAALVEYVLVSDSPTSKSIQKLKDAAKASELPTPQVVDQLTADMFLRKIGPFDDLSALVLGASNYKHVTLLPGAKRDAEIVAKKFRELGFETTVVLDESRTQTLAEIRKFYSRKTRSGIRAVYVVGHGVQVDGTSYFIPRDADVRVVDDLQAEAISLNEFNRNSNNENADLLIFDLMRTNPFPSRLPAQDKETKAKEAFVAAGNDLNMLRTVADEFNFTTWGKLAAGRVKTLEKPNTQAKAQENLTENKTLTELFKEEEKSGTEQLSVPLPPGSPKVVMITETPEALYEKYYEALLRRKFGVAEDGFREILSKFPDHSLAGSVSYQLGETFYAQANFQEAARVYLQTYKTYPKSRRAPDSLMKLGLALMKMNQKKQACSALKAVASEYPHATEAIKRSATEAKRMGCS